MSEPVAGVIPDERRRPLTPAERRRYHRNVLVPQVGAAGQERIRAARVLVVGAGGLGSSAALHLAAAGVGRLGIVDPDAVEISNLQRQILHRTADVGRAKTDSARETLTALNPDVEVLALPLRLTGANAPQVLRGWDVVVDGTDNFPARYLLGDACALLGVPLVHGAVMRTHGQVTVFDAARGPCYRCLHPRPAARPGALLRRSRRARGPAGDHRLHAGRRGPQARDRRGAPAHRTGPGPGRLGRRRHRAAGAQEPRLPDLRGAPGARPGRPNRLNRPGRRGSTVRNPRGPEPDRDRAADPPRRPERHAARVVLGVPGTPAGRIVGWGRRRPSTTGRQ